MMAFTVNDAPAAAPRGGARAAGPWLAKRAGDSLVIALPMRSRGRPGRRSRPA